MKLVTFFLRNIQPYLDPVEFRSRNRLNTSSFPLDSSVTHGRKGIIKIRARLPVLPLGLFLQTDPEVLGILFHPTEIYIYIYKPRYFHLTCLLFRLILYSSLFTMLANPCDALRKSRASEKSRQRQIWHLNVDIHKGR